MTVKGFNLKDKRYRVTNLVVASVSLIEQETKEVMLDDKIKGRLDYIKKNQSFLSLVKSWQVKALQVAATLSDFVPEPEKRLNIKTNLSLKIDKFREENIPISRRRYSR